jgi:hypothetical protein
VSVREEITRNGASTESGGGDDTPPAAEIAVPGVRVAPDAWIRRDDTGRAVAAILSGLAAMVFAVLTVIALFAAVPDADTGTAVAVVGLLAAFTAIFAWLAIRLVAAGVRIDPGEVRLRGMLRTRRIPLGEVERFEAGVFSSLPLHDEIGVRILRRGGRDLDVWALGGGSVVGEGELEAGLSLLEPLCDQLNGLLEEARRGAGAGG